MAGSQALGLAVLQYSKIELIVSVCDNCTGWCEYYGIWQAEGQWRHLWWQQCWPSYWMSLKIPIYRNGVNANHLSSEPSPTPPLNLTTTLALFLSPAILIYSLKSKFFSLDGFVSTVAVFEKFHFIVILRSKIFVITSALKLQAPPKSKGFLLLK